MRDVETINLALHAADTGHLVFSTLHTIDAKETINRIIAQFPTAEQPRIRISLASVIQGIVSQRLVKTVDGKRRAAMEILVKTPRIEKLIMENRDYELGEAIAEGREHYKSQTFDQSILDLFNQKIISEEEALNNATSASDMKLKMSGLNVGNSGESSVTIYEGEDEEDVFDLK